MNKLFILPAYLICTYFILEVKAGESIQIHNPPMQIPQSPRDIDLIEGDIIIDTERTSIYDMNLCNIHIHKNAEHKGAQFNIPTEVDPVTGYNSGFKVSEQRLNSGRKYVIPPNEVNGVKLLEGDTIEVHYVFTTADIIPGPTLGSCFANTKSKPNLNVLAQVFLIVDDSSGVDFKKMSEVKKIEGFYQIPGVSFQDSDSVSYFGSTTGPKYNEVNSPYLVNWKVNTDVLKVNLDSLNLWFSDNQFEEEGPHRVRQLVTDLDHLSSIQSLGGSK